MSWFEQNAPPFAQYPEGPTGGFRMPVSPPPTSGFPGGPMPSTTQAPAPAPTSTPTQGGDPQSTFMQIMQGLPATPQNLVSKEKELNAAGIFVHRNAEGVAGKVQIGQGGPIIDVIHGAGVGGGGSWQWLGPGSGGPGSIGGFQTGTFTGGGQYPLASVMGTGLSQPWTTPFKAPDGLSEQNDPGFKARMAMGQNALERSAASRGTLLSGGFEKALDRYAQDYASNEYSNVYGRALGEYKMAYDIFNNNGNTLFNRLGSLSSIGENAAAGVGNAQMGLGDAQANGSISQGNIWGNAANQIGTTAQGIYNNWPRGANSGTSYLDPNSGFTTPVNIIPPQAG